LAGEGLLAGVALVAATYAAAAVSFSMC